MHTLDQRALGIAILVLMGVLVVSKRVATGLIMRDKPVGNVWVWFVHVFNLFFLLVANPLAALILLTRRFDVFDPTDVAIETPWLLTSLEIGGAVVYVIGYALMGWALMVLRGSYQAGGTEPRAADEMVMSGPYKLVRHPMYSAALCISLGLACLTQSVAYFSVFCIYCLLMVRLIPFEEEGLRQAYGERYVSYQQRVRRLIPLLL